jgi:hypothetical protein
MGSFCKYIFFRVVSWCGTCENAESRNAEKSKHRNQDKPEEAGRSRRTGASCLGLAFGGFPVGRRFS